MGKLPVGGTRRHHMRLRDLFRRWRTTVRGASQPARAERGVALLLTLGILSLLLIVAMSFAFSTRTERMAAGVNADIVKARLLCESGLEQVMGAIRAACAANPTVYPGTRFFADPGDFAGGNTNPWRGRRYLPSMGFYSVIDVESSLAVDMGTCTFTPLWPIIPSGVNKASYTNIYDTTELIGRLAYVVIDNAGMIDPGAVVSATANEALGQETVLGRNPQEIQLGAIPGISAGVADGFRSSMPANGRWYSYYHMARTLSPASSGTGANPSDWESCLATLAPQSKSIEAWRETPTMDTDYCRLDLSNTNWNAATVAGIKANPATIYDGTATTSTSIPWLATLKESVTAADMSNQVAANLIDYCDANGTATTDFALANWPNWPLNPAFINPPTASYCGLENAPYINEIAISVTHTEPGPGTHNLTINIQVELANIYSTANAPSIIVALKFGAPLPPPSVPTPPWGYNPMSGTTTLLPGLPLAVAANSYGVTAVQQLQCAWGGAPGSPLLPLNISDIRIWLIPQGLMAPVPILDFASIGGFAPYAALAVGATVFADAEASDPRCNGRPQDWTRTGFAIAAPSTIGAINSAAVPSGRARDDTETVADPKDGLSTAFIRNAPPQSLWELGCIHRGEPWRTLNLRRFNNTATAATDKFYDNGDANILDQVKLSNDNERRGYVNMNSPQAIVWRTLLNGLSAGGSELGFKVGCTYASPGTTGAVMTQAQISSMAAAILAINGTDGGSAQINRGALALAPQLSDGSVVTQNTNRIQEEIIGKLAGLLTTRSNYFTALLVGQSVKDLGTVTGLPASPDIRIYAGAPTKTCRILAEQRMLVYLSRDVYTNQFAVEQVEYLDR